jgi:hypothetical protein
VTIGDQLNVNGNWRLLTQGALDATLTGLTEAEKVASEFVGESVDAVGQFYGELMCVCVCTCDLCVCMCDDYVCR